MKTVISLLVDDHPKFLMQAWNLVLSLIDTGSFPAPGVELILHHTSSVRRDRLAIFEGLGVSLREVEPFGSGHSVYCNKLRQLETPAVRDADLAVLLDADLLALAPLAPLLVSHGKVRAKIVDAPNPPIAIWPGLLEATGLGNRELPLAKMSLFPNELTPAINCNGGLYIIPQRQMQHLATAWPRWSRFALDHSDLLGNWAHHADQIGFALAMHEANFEIDHLAISDNFPTHFPPDRYAGLAEKPLRFIHYHNRTDNHGLPLPTGVSWVDKQIGAANARLRERRREGFDNRIFWDFRYAHDPELGSGIGSRGKVLDYKRQVLAPWLARFANQPVVDVGCGDLETLREAPLRKVLGLDVSEQALDVARSKRPDWDFKIGSAAELPAGSAALVLCLDVLIHQKSAGDIRAIVSDLVRAATDVVIVSGYDAPPPDRGIVFFHEPLSDLLAAQPDVAQVITLGSYRDTALLAAIKTGLS